MYPELMNKYYIFKGYWCFWASYCDYPMYNVKAYHVWPVDLVRTIFVYVHWIVFLYNSLLIRLAYPYLSINLPIQSELITSLVDFEYQLQWNFSHVVGSLDNLALQMEIKWSEWE